MPTEYMATDHDWQYRGARPISYPRPPQDGGVTEMLHGIRVDDPWRSLEDLNTEVTKTFIDQQNHLSIPLLEAHPAREALTEAVRSSLSTKHTTLPKRQGSGHYYWRWNESMPRDLVLRSKDLDGDFGRSPSESGAEIVLDLNQEEHTSLYMESWSPRGRYYGVVLQKSGSDWQTLRTIDTHTMQYVDNDLGFSKFTFGACWIGDQGFLYKRYIAAFIDGPVPDEDDQFGLFYHQLGTPQIDDTLIWRGTGPSAKSYIMGRPRVVSASEWSTEARKWLTLDIYLSTNPESEVLMIELSPLKKCNGEVIKDLFAQEMRWLSKGFTGQTLYIGSANDGTHLFRSTADGHSNGRIVSTSSEDWDFSEAGSTLALHEVIPSHPKSWPISQAQLMAGGVIVVVYLHDACAAVVFYDLASGKEIGETDSHGTEGSVTISSFDIPVPPDEKPQEVPSPVVIPKHASISELAGRPDSTELFLSVETFISMPYILRAKVQMSGSSRQIELELLDQSTEPPIKDLTCSQVFYPAEDGTRIPLFLCHRTDLDLSRSHPTLLHAYGGFGIPIRPHFDAFFYSFMRSLNGIVAVAGIRGGGEYGKAWHDAAIGTNKTVAWDDFASAARYLHSSGISTPAQTAIYGTSNGGLLVSASIVRNPELFAVALPDVALTDLIRFHKFTLGRFWKSEYGDPTNPDDLRQLHKQSPLHNVRDVDKYPSILVTTAENDNRVVPGHSLKFIAELQSRASRNSPVFLGRIYSDTGHEPGAKSVDQKVQEAVDRLVFILSYMPQVHK